MYMVNNLIEAESRSSSGSASARKIRKLNQIPSIMYDKEQQNMISVPKTRFMQLYLQGGIQSRLIKLKLNGEEISVLVREVQLDPVTDSPVHVDFQRVKNGVRIKVHVLVNVINKSICAGVKRGGVLNLVSRRIAMRCDPDHIPNRIDVDVSKLGIGESIHINDLNLDKSNFEPVDKSNFVILSISGSASDVEEAEKK